MLFQLVLQSLTIRRSLYSVLDSMRPSKFYGVFAHSFRRIFAQDLSHCKKYENQSSFFPFVGSIRLLCSGNPVVTKTVSRGPGKGVEWIEWIKTLSDLDTERELHRIKRKMGTAYSKGDYDNALGSAIMLEEAVETTMGKDNVVYASCLNNIAVMNKMLGANDAAMAKYTEALHLYRDKVGHTHRSYASTLSNMGILYRSMAEPREGSAKGMDKLQLLERAEEALTDALKIRLDLEVAESFDGKLGGSKDALSASMNLAMVWRLKEFNRSSDKGKGRDECISELRSLVLLSKETHGDMDSLTAVILSNLGLALKESGSSCFEEARAVYTDALHVRSSTLGDSHPDTIISMHNLAELLQVMSNHNTLSKEQAKQYVDEGLALQERILEIMDADGTINKDSKNHDHDQTEKSEISIKNEVKYDALKTDLSPPVTFSKRPTGENFKDGTKIVTRKKKDQK